MGSSAIIIWHKSKCVHMFCMLNLFFGKYCNEPTILQYIYIFCWPYPVTLPLVVCQSLQAVTWCWRCMEAQVRAAQMMTCRAAAGSQWPGETQALTWRSSSLPPLRAAEDQTSTDRSWPTYVYYRPTCSTWRWHVAHQENRSWIDKYTMTKKYL